MYAYDLTGKKHRLKLKGRQSQHKSSLHVKALKLLKQKWPTVPIIEEFPVKVLPSKTLVLDFFIYPLMLAIETHGPQHYNLNSKFHSNTLAFLRQVKNDKMKREWCNVNNVVLIELSFDNQKEWESIIDERI